MLRYLVLLTALTIIVVAGCNNRAAVTQSKSDVEFTCVVFNGPASVSKFDGKISLNLFTKWFREDYRVGGQRIEAPRNATVVGALILMNEPNSLIMPICTWTVESGHTYFACQSESIGNAPMFRVSTKSTTIDEFLLQMERRMTELANAAG